MKEAFFQQENGISKWDKKKDLGKEIIIFLFYIFIPMLFSKVSRHVFLFWARWDRLRRNPEKVSSEDCFERLRELAVFRPAGKRMRNFRINFWVTSQNLIRRY